MFDSLVLLGQGGHMVYSGQSKNALALLSSCPHTSLNSTDYDNPGDFIIDILGLAENEFEENSLDGGECLAPAVPSSRSRGTELPHVETDSEHDGYISSASQLLGESSTVRSERSVNARGGRLPSQLVECVSLEDTTECLALTDLESSMPVTDDLRAKRETIRNTTAAKALSDHFYHSLAFVSIMRDIECSMSQYQRTVQRRNKTTTRSAAAEDHKLNNHARLLSRAREMVAGGLMGLQQSSPQYARIDIGEDDEELEMRPLNVTSSPCGATSSPLSVSSEGSEEKSLSTKVDDGGCGEDDEDEEEEELVLNEMGGGGGDGSSSKKVESDTQLPSPLKVHRGQCKYGFILPPVLSDGFAGRGDTKHRGSWWDRTLLQLWVSYSRRLTVSAP